MRGVVASLFVLVAGCPSAELGLSVDAKTDYVPGVEFRAVTVEVFAADPASGARAVSTTSRAVLVGQDFIVGRRVADLAMPRGQRWLRMRLLAVDGLVVAERVITIQMSASQIVVVVLSRSCEDGECAECSDASDCPPPAVACLEAQCVERLCLAAPREEACLEDEYCDLARGCTPLPEDAPREDAGMDPPPPHRDAGPRPPDRDAGPPPPPPPPPPDLDAGPVPTCNDCAAGSRRCVDGDRYQECGDADGDGCTEWSGEYSCGTSYPGTRCEAGYCVGSGGGCTDDCSDGAKQCLDGDRYQECGEYDGDACRDWSGPYSCSASWPGTTCSGGYCVGGGPGCTDECSSGAKRCLDGDLYVECRADIDADPCTEWSGAYSCSASWPGTTCSAGYCVGP